jgi:hypothetical protein
MRLALEKILDAPGVLDSLPLTQLVVATKPAIRDVESTMAKQKAAAKPEAANGVPLLRASVSLLSENANNIKIRLLSLITSVTLRTLAEEENKR